MAAEPSSDRLGPYRLPVTPSIPGRERLEPEIVANELLGAPLAEEDYAAARHSGQRRDRGSPPVPQARSGRTLARLRVGRA
jgi:hypothetical protein